MRRLISVLVSGILVALLGSSASGEQINVALQSNGGTASAISVGSYMGCTGYASYANDGSYGTNDWCDNWDMPAWVMVQFNQPYLIDRVATLIHYHQQTFAISLSQDGSNWTQVVPPTLSQNQEGIDPQTGLESADYESFDIESMLAEYIKVDITTTSALPSHIFQAIIGEVEAYSSVPEPSTLVLLGVGAVSLLAYAWRRRKAA